MNNRHCNEEKQAGRRGLLAPADFGFVSGHDFSRAEKKLKETGPESLRENWVSLEGHGFSRAVNDIAIPGFSR